MGLVFQDPYSLVVGNQCVHGLGLGQKLNGLVFIPKEEHIGRNWNVARGIAGIWSRETMSPYPELNRAKGSTIEDSNKDC